MCCNWLFVDCDRKTLLLLVSLNAEVALDCGRPCLLLLVGVVCC